MRRTQTGKYVTCYLCGQVGATLEKMDEGKYVCADRVSCRRRQQAKVILGGDICGHYYCQEKAVGACSCGVKVCGTHLKSIAHSGHIVKKGV